MRRFNHLLLVAAVFAATALELTGLMATTLPAEEVVRDHRQSYEEIGARAQNGKQSGDADATKRAIIEKFERVYIESKQAFLTWRGTRTRIDVDLTKEAAEPEVKYDIRLRAKAVMKPDAHWLLVWEGHEGSTSDQPVFKIHFENAMIREDIWYPAAKQYRTKRYAAPTKFGANDTEFEHACMIGALLQTWTGRSWQVEVLLENFQSGELLPDLSEVRGDACNVFRLARPASEDLATGTRYERTDLYFINNAGHLVRWETTVTNTSPALQTIIKQIQEFDFAPSSVSASNGPKLP